MTNEELIAEIVKKRKEKGLTQTQLSELTGLTQSVIARVESLKVVPRLDCICRLVTALDCSLQIKNAKV